MPCQSVPAAGGVDFGEFNPDLHPHGEHGRWAKVQKEESAGAAVTPGTPDVGQSGGPKPDGTRGDTKFPSQSELGSLKQVKMLGGSTGARLMQGADGTKYVMKKGASPAHIREEFACDSAYRALGFTVQDSTLYETPSGPVKLARYLDDVKPLGAVMAKATPEQSAKIVSEVRKGFAADALLGNWDVIGMQYDNVMVTPDGHPVRIDNGGSLRFRAQGERKKPEQWNEVADEVNTMRGIGRGSKTAASIFGGITDGEIAEQVKSLVGKKDSLLAAVPADVRSTVDARLKGMSEKFKAGDTATADPAGFYRERDLHAEGEWPVLSPVAMGVGRKPREARKTYGGVVFNPEGKVLLREPKNHFDNYVWTFAKGGGEPGEKPADVALREVREETGHSTKIVGHVPGAHSSGPGSASYFYLMHADGGTPAATDAETSQVKWATPEEARELISLTENPGGRARDLRLLDAAVRAYSAAKQATLSRDASYWTATVVYNGVATDRLSLFAQLDATPGMTEAVAMRILDSARRS